MKKLTILILSTILFISCSPQTAPVENTYTYTIHSNSCFTNFNIVSYISPHGDTVARQNSDASICLLCRSSKPD